jgi:hypothetical protein
MKPTTPARRARGAVCLVVLIALTALAGCGNGNGDIARLERLQAASPEMLFGATPPPLGGEDLGYFAALPRHRDGVVPFDYTVTYVRRTVYDHESTRHPFSSGHRTRVHSVEQQLSLDQRR